MQEDIPPDILLVFSHYMRTDFLSAFSPSIKQETLLLKETENGLFLIKIYNLLLLDH